MIDIEKTIKGIESCLSPHDPDCDLCPYDSIDLRCRAKLRDDIMTLLKEQEPIKPINVHMYSKMYANVRSGYCPICNNEVDEEEDNNFCCKCGRRLNWDA